MRSLRMRKSEAREEPAVRSRSSISKVMSFRGVDSDMAEEPASHAHVCAAFQDKQVPHPRTKGECSQ
jgi:hypothetical protein